MLELFLADYSLQLNAINNIGIIDKLMYEQDIKIFLHFVEWQHRALQHICLFVSNRIFGFSFYLNPLPYS